ncbi:MAG: molybdopterin molybdotransferase MoeA [Pyrinomonadaceae bacterium]
MTPISEALEIIRREVFRLESERVVLAETGGRILTEEIRADMDLPPFDRSQMDGFAVKTDDVRNAPVSLRIAGESAAGRGWSGTLQSGEAVRIMTGAPVPAGADSVQKVELTEEENGFIKILKPTATDQNIVRKGAEMKADQSVFGPGELITDNMIATLASFGYQSVSVSRRPKVSILATGSEIVEIGDTPGADQIRNSNSAMLAAFAGRLADVTVLPIARDDLENLKKTVREAIRSCDLLVISGGVSVGDYDFTKPALREIGADVFFERVSLKPGKPTVFARRADTLIFGLPGNPVSIAVTFFVFVRMALLEMQNAAITGLKKGFARLTHPIKATRERDALLPVSLETDEAGHLTIETLRFSGSSNFIAFARANGLVFVPRNKDLEKGEVAKIYFL